MCIQPVVGTSVKQPGLPVTLKFSVQSTSTFVAKSIQPELFSLGRLLCWRCIFPISSLMDFEMQHHAGFLIEILLTNRTRIWLFSSVYSYMWWQISFLGKSKKTGISSSTIFFRKKYPFPHTSQGYGFSPVCTNRWCFNAPFCGNFLPQV